MVGSLICFQISGKDPKSLNPAKYIGSRVESKEDEPFRITQVRWIHRDRSAALNGTYIEGSMRGNLWIRDINYEHEKMLRIPTDFSDKIKTIHYSGDKNMAFVSCRDGRLKCWKLPHSWLHPVMEQIINEYDFKKKEQERNKLKK